MSKRHILKEKQDCKAAGVPFFSPTEDLYTCLTLLLGPANSPYEDGVYFLTVRFPTDYPFKPPIALFLTPIYHPNINNNGAVYIGDLRQQWTPALTLARLLRDIEELLEIPKFEVILNSEAAQDYVYDRAKYWMKAEEMKRKYAI